MSELEKSRKRWLLERPNYEAFGELVAKRLAKAIQQQGIWCDTTRRAKELHSLIKKLLKNKYSYENLPDKGGVRCVVRFRSEVDTVVSLACQLFDCSELDMKLERLGEDRIGYASTHLKIQLKQDDRHVVNYPREQYWAELQVRTLGQHLWSEMVHDSFYKDELALASLPVGFKRRVNLMSGLIEVADSEFDRLHKEKPSSLEAELYKSLEQYYFKLSATRPDPELSFEVIGLLMPLYGQASIGEIEERIGNFFTREEKLLHSIYEQAEHATTSPFLYQPEVLMIYERLTVDQLATRMAWNTRFPEKELESIANTFGISFD